MSKFKMKAVALLEVKTQSSFSFLPLHLGTWPLQRAKRGLVFEIYTEEIGHRDSHLDTLCFWWRFNMLFSAVVI